MSDFFHYKNGELYAEDCSVAALAEKYGTPFYLYSAESIRQSYAALDGALGGAGLDYGIFYALKANSNQAVVSLLRSCGGGADVVSGGEIRRALLAGIAADKIVFSGVGKSQAELALALEAGILQFNIESTSELLLLNQVAKDKGAVAEVAFRINPDVDAKTHAKISTGKSENKFGIPLKEAPALYAEAEAMAHVKPVSVAVHIGSQLTDLQPFAQAWERVRDLAMELQAGGIDIKRLDLGGGLGVAYDGGTTVPMSDYAALVASVFADFKGSFMFEPGRSLVAHGGILVSRVLHIKDGSAVRFVITDAAMNDFLRPTLYDGFHRIDSVREGGGGGASGASGVGGARGVVSDVVGPVCESGDFFAKARDLPAGLQAGDLLAVRDVGAYGAVMSGTYNTRPLVAEVMVQGGASALIRASESETDIIARDSVPDWV